MLDQSYYKKADEIIEFYGRKAAALIPIMQDIQAEYRYLPGELLTYVAAQIGITEAKAYSVATFYENFSFEAKGKYVIKVCDGTACHVRKSMPVKEAMMKELGLTAKKHTTDDMMFTVETVSCLGACGLAPTCTVNDEVHPKMTPEAAVELLNELRGDKA
ncbi:MAG: NAD(P)H-dependent oxidoreductase subunit E [Clostridiales bacterium]|nr:NAD(P)H-dependent oxidoreductase subunit E [Candidatus Blautia equi]